MGLAKSGQSHSASMLAVIAGGFGLTVLARQLYHAARPSSRTRRGVSALPKFFLIDPSLDRLGVHHFDFAQCVVSAARRCGWETFVAAHRRFRAESAALAGAETHSVFRNTSYSKYSYLAGMAAMARLPMEGIEARPQALDKSPGIVRDVVREWSELWLDQYRTAQRRTLIRQFAADCERFFAPHVFEEGDTALLAAASDIELLGLAAYLSNHPRTNQVDWHLLFHFSLFHGRPTEYNHQFQTAQRVRQCFTSALQRIPFHRVSFHTTTDELSKQFERLNVGSFQNLTYPINEKLTAGNRIEARSTSTNRPLRLTFAGAIRREKKQCQVAQSVVHALWDDLFASRHIELQIQRPYRSRLLRPKIEIHPPPSVQVAQPFVTYRDHPLSEAEYIELIQSTDIGLLAYDPDMYYARRAGILGEYLSVGRPVVVVAASWLAETVQDAANSYVPQLIRDHEVTAQWKVDSSGKCVPWSESSADVLSFERGPICATLELEHPVDALAVQYFSHYPQSHGAFCRIDFQSFSHGNPSGKSQSVVLGSRAATDLISTVFTIRPGADRCQIRLSNACNASRISVRDLRVTGLATGGQKVPRSSIGFIAADFESIPDAVREVVEHYAHYRSTAEIFSEPYRIRHRPSVTFGELVPASAISVDAVG